MAGLPFAAISIIVAACAPSNSGPVYGLVTPAPATATPTAAATATATPSAVPVPTLAAFSVATTVPVSTGTKISVLGAGAPAGFSIGVTLPATTKLPAGTVVKSKASSSASASLPKLTGQLRTVLGRSVLAENAPLTAEDFLDLYFETTSSFTIPAGFVIEEGLPSAVLALSGVSFDIALYDTTRPSLGWIDRYATCTIGSISVVCTSQYDLLISPAADYYFALYAVSSSATPPTAPPSVAVVPPTPDPNFVAVTPGTSATSVTLPAEAGVTGSITIPGLTGGSAILGIGSSIGTDIGLPALTGSDVASVLYYGGFQTTGATTVPGGTTVSFSGSVPTGATYYLATYDNSQPTAGWFTRVSGPGVFTNSGTLTFTIPQGTALKASTGYGFALYSSVAGAPATSFTASASAQTVALLAVNNVVGSIVVPAASTGVGNTISITSKATPPISTATLPNVGNILYFAQVSASGTTIIGGNESLQLSVPNASIPSGSSVYVGLYDSSTLLGWQLAVAGPAKVTANPDGTTSNIAFSLGQSATLQASTKAQYGVIVYTQSASKVQPATSTATISNGGTITLPSSGGYGGSVTVGSASNGSTVSLSATNQPPVGLAAAGIATVYYVAVTPATTVTVGNLSASVTVPSGTLAAGDKWWISTYDSSAPGVAFGWNLDLVGPFAVASASNTTMTFSTTKAWTLSGGVTYYLALNKY